MMDVLKTGTGKPSGTIVHTDIRYTYQVLIMNLRTLKRFYPFLETGWIGCSELRCKIPYLRLGIGPKEVFYSASFHANEWITTPLLMRFTERFLKACVCHTDICGYSARRIFNTHSIYIVPMVNPDGVNLVTGAIRPGTRAYAHAKSIAGKYPEIPFPEGWKANINGIDLNSNYPACWRRARKIKFGLGFTGPSPRDYVGPYPLSAAESAAVYRFTRKHNFRLVLAYHTQGSVIFWQYENYLPKQSLAIGKKLSKASGYALEQTAYAASFAGYKDWFIQAYNRPGYTVEAGFGENPLPITQFHSIYPENERILILGAVLAP